MCFLRLWIDLTRYTVEMEEMKYTKYGTIYFYTYLSHYTHMETNLVSGWDITLFHL